MSYDQDPPRQPWPPRQAPGPRQPQYPPQQPWPAYGQQQPYDQAPYPPQWQQPYAAPQPPQGPPSGRRRKRRRVFPWVFLAIQALFVIWVIAGAASGHSAAANCHDQYLTHQQCANATDAGTAIGVGLIIVFWAVVDVIMGISYGVWRLSRR